MKRKPLLRVVMWLPFHGYRALPIREAGETEPAQGTQYHLPKPGDAMAQRVAVMIEGWYSR